MFVGGAAATAFEPRQGFDTVTRATENISATVFINNFLKDLDILWPNASSYYTGEATISAPWFDKHFLGSYSAYGKGQYSTLHGYSAQRQGNIHFSGEYTSIESRAFMEGAATEGKRAADEIINDALTNN